LNEIADSTDAPCQLAVVATKSEVANAVAQRLRGSVTNRGKSVTAHIGGFQGRRVVVAEGQPEAADEIIAALRTAHRPALVVTCGFCVSLSEAVGRDALLLADQIDAADGKTCHIDVAPVPGPTRRGMTIGKIVTIDTLPPDPPARRELAQHTGAVAADLDSARFAHACLRFDVPLLVLKVVTQAYQDEVPRNVSRIFEQKSWAGKAGALARAVWERPKDVKHLWDAQQAQIRWATRWGIAERGRLSGRYRLSPIR